MARFRRKRLDFTVFSVKAMQILQVLSHPGINREAFKLNNFPIFVHRFPNFNRIYLPLPSQNFIMANHKATKKDVRQATKRRDRNRYYGKTTRNAVRELRALTDKKTASKDLVEVSSMIDKLAKKGIVHKNKAANLKSKLTRKVNGLSA